MYEYLTSRLNHIHIFEARFIGNMFKLIPFVIILLLAYVLKPIGRCNGRHLFKSTEKFQTLVGFEPVMH